MASFVTTGYVRSERPLTYEYISPGELAVRRNEQVKATDGYVGRVAEFLANPRTRHIIHLVLQEGWLWGRREVTVPVSEIDRMDEETIYLRHDRHDVESLPAIL